MVVNSIGHFGDRVTSVKVGNIRVLGFNGDHGGTEREREREREKEREGCGT